MYILDLSNCIILLKCPNGGNPLALGDIVRDITGLGIKPISLDSGASDLIIPTSLCDDELRYGTNDFVDAAEILERVVGSFTETSVVVTCMSRRN